MRKSTQRFCCSAAVLLVAIFCNAQTGRSQPGLPVEMQSVVYRIQQMDGSYGTAILLREGDFQFLLTNWHVLRNDQRKMPESVYVYWNHRMPNGEVISGPDHFTLYPFRGKDTTFFRPAADSVDLVLVSISSSTTNVAKGMAKVYTIDCSELLNRKTFGEAVEAGGIYTAIGYPSKAIGEEDVARYPEYRWGQYVGTDSRFLKTNIPIIPGSSGSPVVVYTHGQYYFVGIATMLVNGVCHITPIFEALEQFDAIFKRATERSKPVAPVDE